MISFSLNDYSFMTQEEKDAVLDALVEAAQSGDTRVHDAVLNAQIRRFESRYGMSSDDMVIQVESGQMQETAEISEWMFLLHTPRKRVAR